eukprot:jgi/Mesvir1/23549/Mv18246-RA.2
MGHSHHGRCYRDLPQGYISELWNAAVLLSWLNIREPAELGCNDKRPHAVWSYICGLNRPAVQVLNFKLDKTNTLWLLFCSSLRLAPADRVANPLNLDPPFIEKPKPMYLSKREALAEGYIECPPDSILGPNYFSCPSCNATVDAKLKYGITYKSALQQWLKTLVDHAMEKERPAAGTVSPQPNGEALLLASGRIPPTILRFSPNLTWEMFLELRHDPTFLFRNAYVCEECCLRCNATSLLHIQQPSHGLSRSQLEDLNARSASRAGWYASPIYRAPADEVMPPSSIFKDPTQRTAYVSSREGSAPRPEPTRPQRPFSSPTRSASATARFTYSRAGGMPSLNRSSLLLHGDNSEDASSYSQSYSHSLSNSRCEHSSSYSRRDDAPSSRRDDSHYSAPPSSRAESNGAASAPAKGGSARVSDRSDTSRELGKQDGSGRQEGGERRDGGAGLPRSSQREEGSSLPAPRAGPPSARRLARHLSAPIGGRLLSELPGNSSGAPHPGDAAGSGSQGVVFPGKSGTSSARQAASYHEQLHWHHRPQQHRPSQSRPESALQGGGMAGGGRSAATRPAPVPVAGGEGQMASAGVMDNERQDGQRGGRNPPSGRTSHRSQGEDGREEGSGAHGPSLGAAVEIYRQPPRVRPVSALNSAPLQPSTQQGSASSQRPRPKSNDMHRAPKLPHTGTATASGGSHVASRRHVSEGHATAPPLDRSMGASEAAGSNGPSTGSGRTDFSAMQFSFLKDVLQNWKDARLADNGANASSLLPGDESLERLLELGFEQKPPSYGTSGRADTQVPGYKGNPAGDDQGGERVTPQATASFLNDLTAMEREFLMEVAKENSDNFTGL